MQCRDAARTMTPKQPTFESLSQISFTFTYLPNPSATTSIRHLMGVQQYCCGLLGVRTKTRKKTQKVEQLYWINRTYIQNRSVSTEVSVQNCQFRLLGGSRYLLFVPPNRPVWHNTLFRWIRAQGHSPDTPGDSKNASGTDIIPLKRSPLTARR